MDNALSFDLEYWYSNDFISNYIPNAKGDYLFESVRPILRLLDRYNTRATFFIVGNLAEKNPGLIKKIYDLGHEIGSHGYSHHALYNLDKEKFDRELKKSVDILRTITGESPKGFRAPCFSVNNSTKWVFDILEKNSFNYDSSIFPIKTMLYGVPNANLNIYRPSKNDVAKHDPDGKITEFPLTTIRFLRNIPISGGFYFRVLPSCLIKCGFKLINKGRPGILYLHPWETNINIPKLEVPSFAKFVTYYGKNTILEKLEVMLKDFSFKPVRDVLDGI